MRPSPSPYTIRPLGHYLGTLGQAPSADRTSLLGSLSVEIASTFSFNRIVSGPEPGRRYGDCRPTNWLGPPQRSPRSPRSPSGRPTHLLHLNNFLPTSSYPQIPSQKTRAADRCCSCLSFPFDDRRWESRQLSLAVIGSHCPAYQEISPLPQSNLFPLLPLCPSPLFVRVMCADRSTWLGGGTKSVRRKSLMIPPSTLRLGTD